jgi:hypothetical protein
MEGLVEDVSGFVNSGENIFSRAQIIKALGRCNNDVDDTIALLLDSGISEDEDGGTQQGSFVDEFVTGETTVIEADSTLVSDTKMIIDNQSSTHAEIDILSPSLSSTEFAFSCVAKHILPSQDFNFSKHVHEKNFEFSLTQLIQSNGEIVPFAFDIPSPDDICKYRLLKQTVKGKGASLSNQKILEEMIIGKEQKDTLPRAPTTEAAVGKKRYGPSLTKGGDKKKQTSSASSVDLSKAARAAREEIALRDELRRISRLFSANKQRQLEISRKQAFEEVHNVRKLQEQTRNHASLAASPSMSLSTPASSSFPNFDSYNEAPGPNRLELNVLLVGDPTRVNTMAGKLLQLANLVGFHDAARFGEGLYSQTSFPLPFLTPSRRLFFLPATGHVPKPTQTQNLSPSDRFSNPYPAGLSQPAAESVRPTGRHPPLRPLSERTKESVPAHPAPLASCARRAGQWLGAQPSQHLVETQLGPTSSVLRADCALLLVDANLCDDPSALVDGASLATLCALRHVGIASVLVAVSGLRERQWSESKFKRVVMTMTAGPLKQAGFEDITCVPMCEHTLENVFARNGTSSSSSSSSSSTEGSRKSLQHWYFGPSLYQALDALPPVEHLHKPSLLQVTLLGLPY